LIIVFQFLFVSPHGRFIQEDRMGRERFIRLWVVLSGRKANNKNEGMSIKMCAAEKLTGRYLFPHFAFLDRLWIRRDLAMSYGVGGWFVVGGERLRRGGENQFFG
jgi:hypothetical protein